MSTGGGGVLLWMDDDVSSACDDVNRDQQYGRGSTWTGSPIALPLASYVAISGRGYTVLHVHNESSASGQAPEEEGPGRRVQRSQLRLAPPNGITFV